MKQALWELAVDSDSDVWSQKMMGFFSIFLEGDDFVAETEISGVAMLLLDEPMYFCVKKVWKVFVYQIIPLFNSAIFCCQDNAVFIYSKTNPRVYTINMQSFLTIHSQTNSRCFSEYDYPVCLQTFLGSLGPALLQHAGTVAQKGLKSKTITRLTG